MMENCLSEGTIQAFLDGELAAEALDAATQHIALCDACAFLLSKAEEETSFAFAALEQEYNALVPTQRLWTKINSSIEEERKAKSAWQRFLAGVSSVGAYLGKPSVAAFASFLFVAVTFSYLWLSRPMPNKNFIAVEDGSSGAIEIAENRNVSPTNATQSEAGITEQPKIEAAENSGNEAVKIIKSIERKPAVNRSFETVDYRPGSAKPSKPVKPFIDSSPSPTTLEYIPGEESYTKTIATLKNTVDGGKDLNLKPSERVAFEKDMAVINDAIKKMQAEVRKNPKNEAAKQILFASYQNKIDLLNSVSERNDLMASIR